MVHFLSGALADVGGGVLIAFGVLSLAIGVQRFRWFGKRISVLSRPPTDPETRAMLLAHRDNYQI